MPTGRERCRARGQPSRFFARLRACSAGDEGIMTKREANLKPLFTWRSAVASPYGPPDPTTRLVLLTLGLRVNGYGELTVPTVAELAIESGLREEVVELHLRIAAEQ